MMSYDPSSLNRNKTLLEAIEEVKKFLIANPCYKVFYSNTNYVIGTTTYSKTYIDDPDSMAEYDVVFFDNNYYGKVESVGDSTFTIIGATNFKGDTGAQGIPGTPGTPGADGQDGTDGTDGVSITNVSIDGSNHLICTLSDGNTIDAGAISAPVYAVEVSSLSATLTQDEVSILEHDNSLLLFTQAGLTQVYTKYKEDSTVIRFISPNTDTSKYYYLSGVQLTKSTGVLSSYFINFNVRSGIVNSETATNGQVLTADGTGGASWESPSTPSVEGTAVLSTGETSGKVLTADGSGGASWQTAGGGGSLYQHYVEYTYNTGSVAFVLRAILITNSSTAFSNTSDFISALYNGTRYCIATGKWVDISNSKYSLIMGINAISSSAAYALVFDADTTTTSGQKQLSTLGSLTDRVYQIQ